MEPQNHIFRPGLLQTFWAMGSTIAIVFILLTPIYFRTWSVIELLQFFALLLCVLILPLTAISVWLSKTTILPSGIRGYNFYGVFRTVTWEEMEHISRFYYFGITYLRIRTVNKRWTLWLPLFHLEQQRLEELIGVYAPPRHIIRNYILVKMP